MENFTPNTNEEAEKTNEDLDSRLDLAPGVMVFTKNIQGEDRPFAEVYQANGDGKFEGKFAVLTDVPETGYDKESAIPHSQQFDTLQEANKALLDYTKTNNLTRAGGGYAEY